MRKGDELPPEEVEQLMGIAIPPHIASALRKVKNGEELTPMDKKLIADWYDEVRRDPSISVSTLLQVQMGFTEKDYRRMRNLIRKFIDSGENKSVSRLLAIYENKDLKKFVEDLWRNVKRVGGEVVIKVYNMAIEMGYTNSDGTVRIADFMIDSANFYYQYRDLVEDMAEELEDMRAMCKMLLDTATQKYVTTALVNKYLDFVYKVILLRSLGYPVPTDIIDKVKSQIDAVIGDINE